VKRLVLLFAASGTAIVILILVLLSTNGLLKDNLGAEAQTASRPNFVVVMTDDLDDHTMANLAGIRTLMGSEGATFQSAYVTYSLCCPSRASFLRGQYPHNHQILHTNPPLGGEAKFRELGRDQSTIATWLDDDGYRTKYIGKYMNGYSDLYKPPGWDEWFVLQGDPTKNQVNDDGTSVTLSGNSADAFANEAADFVRRSSTQAAPFFAVIGTRAPHTPPEVPMRYEGSFANATLPKPPNFDEEDLSDKPQWISGKKALSQDEVDRMQEHYRDQLRSMLAVEDLLEQIIATLEDTGELSTTYIFFTSDNGFHLGNHRLRSGKSTPYEEDIGVPLMVRGPGVPAGAIRQQLVINNDLAPTIAELAGVLTPAFVDGRSFAPLLTSSPPSSWRQAFLEEGWIPEVGLQIPTHKGVHTRDRMLLEYDTAERELYDLALDPYQLQSKPRLGNEALYAPLETRLYNLRDCVGAGCRTAEWTTDATAPRVTVTSPGSSAVGVFPSANLTATFSEDMKTSSVNPTTFLLSERGASTKVSATVAYSSSTDKATLDPANPLKRGATNDARVTSGAKDLVGNRLDQSGSAAGLQQKVWSFAVAN
jgi:arylsulfatase A-like enzyme